ncbi:autotransporter-associated beta strand repeat-containing protein [Roseibacillus persicicus]|uniref:Uncharacterized protein n=1 Tax=Roseibacillus persicicus TaxID=454148 RepID=A0A918WPY8_9BACT|nr:autotransporter-associated beta strand repeat-containing protein [Roseibacillus persicicus]GHC66741.1 hypothetical protein GCM10007100_38240 [Roseibacillus persicicus]
MKFRKKSVYISVLLTACIGQCASALTVVSGTPSSYGVLQGEFQADPESAPTWGPSNNNADRSGAGGGNTAQRVNEPVWGFQVPSITAGESVSEVVFTFDMASTAVQSGANHTAVVSLMTHDDFTDFSGGDFVSSQTALGAGVLVGTFDNTDLSNGATISFSLEGAALTQFAGLYDASGNPTQAEVWFRISYDNFTWEWPVNANDRYQFADNNDGNVTRTLTVTSIDAATIADSLRVETADDGSGVVVPSQTLTAGDPALTVFSIGRDASNGFIGNAPASWSLNVIEGNITAADLVPAADNQSALFFPTGPGSAEIVVSGAANNFVSSGVITVVAGPAATLTVETAIDGSGEVVGDTVLQPGEDFNVYAILRDAAGNYLDSELSADATFTLANVTGDIEAIDLLDFTDGSANFLAVGLGTANIRASLTGFADADSGLITVEPLQNRWVSTGASSWPVAAHWLNGVLPDFDNTTDLFFHDASATKRNTYLQGNHTVRSLNYNEFADSPFNVRYTTNGLTGAENLTFDTDSVDNPAEINIDAGAEGSFKLGNVGSTANEYGVTILADDLLITHEGTGTLTFDVPITEVNGSKSIIKTGAGTVSFAAENTFTGTTTVNEGLLLLNGKAIHDSATLSIDGSGQVQVTEGNIENVGSLVLGGIAQADGTYGPTGSGAETINDLYFAATSGLVNVGAPVLNAYESFVSVIVDPADRGIEDDPDGDGIPNGIEFVIGGSPLDSSDLAFLPTGEFVNVDLGNGPSDYIQFTYRSRSDVAPLAPGVEYDTDLQGDDWVLSADGVNGVVIQTTGNGFEAGIDRVDVYLPSSLAIDGKIFARLSVRLTQ